MIVANISCLFSMIFVAFKTSSVPIRALQKIQLLCSGFIAFIADTLGIGSFAPNILLAKLFKTFKDEELPAVNNGAQVLPGLLEALFFINIIEVDLKTLLTLVAGTCIGGIIGGVFISRLDKQKIRLVMIFAFNCVIVLLLLHKFQLIPFGGNASELTGIKLLMGFVGMLLCGALTAAGVGLFVMVQAVLFVLNVSPVVAFPIMSVAGAMQQPLTTGIFLYYKKIPLRKTLLLSLGGCAGVLVTIPIFIHLKVQWLHNLLILLLLTNVYIIGRHYLNETKHLMLCRNGDDAVISH